MNKRFELFYPGFQCIKCKVIVDIVALDNRIFCLLTDPEDNPGDALAWAFTQAASTVYLNLMSNVPPDQITWISYFPLGEKYSVQSLKTYQRGDSVNRIMEITASVTRNKVIPSMDRKLTYRVVKMSWGGEWYVNPEMIEVDDSIIKQINEAKTTEVSPIYGNPAEIKQSIYVQGNMAMSNFHSSFRVRTVNLDDKVVVVLSEGDDNIGTSLTNSYDLAASFVYWNCLSEIEQEKLIFVEHYPTVEKVYEENTNFETRYTLVDLIWDERLKKYERPQWRPIPDHIAERIDMPWLEAVKAYRRRKGLA